MPYVLLLLTASLPSLATLAFEWTTDDAPANWSGR